MIPPGARRLFGEIASTTSVSVRLFAANRLGLTSTSKAAWVVPYTLACATPGYCSIAGTIWLFASAPSATGLYFFDVSESVMMFGSLGSATRIVGAWIAEGSWRCAACSAFSTLAMFSVSVEVSANAAAIETLPFSIVVSM